MEMFTFGEAIHMGSWGCLVVVLLQNHIVFRFQLEFLRLRVADFMWVSKLVVWLLKCTSPLPDVGDILVWGRNSCGQLGSGDFSDSSKPHCLGKFSDFCCGWKHTTVVTSGCSSLTWFLQYRWRITMLW